MKACSLLLNRPVRWTEANDSDLSISNREKRFQDINLNQIPLVYLIDAEIDVHFCAALFQICPEIEESAILHVA